MCGRFTNQYSWRDLIELYEITEPWIGPQSNQPARYNIAPMQNVFVVREKDGKRGFLDARWGLVPYWSKDAKSAARMINARAETVETTPAFRDAFKARPCLVPASGYYEWQQVTAKEKQPCYFTLKNNAPFAFAGLYEFWPAERLTTFALLTTEPNALAASVHDRMPVILGKQDWAHWLASPDERRKLLGPYPAELMQMWPVGRAVGNVKNEGPELIVPVPVEQPRLDL